MNFRKASLADVGRLAEMNHRLIRDEGHRNPMSVVELSERMAIWLAGEYEAVLFEDNQGIAGYALFKSECEWVYLRQFFVKPERRRLRVGTRAIEWLLGHVWQNAPRIRLEVLVGNSTGAAFWRSLGFSDYCVTMERTI